MSLINDAIKRAGQSPAPAPKPLETAAGMRPIEYQRPSRFPWIIVLAVLTPVFGLAIWFMVKGWQLSQSSPRAVQEVVAQARSQAPVPPTTPDPALVGFQVPQIAPDRNADGHVRVSADPSAAAISPSIAVPVEPAKPSFPELKLQGIYWRPSRPSAVINSKTVYVGDKVEGTRVTAIDNESVTVQWEAETKVLTFR